MKKEYRNGIIIEVFTAISVVIFTWTISQNYIPDQFLFIKDIFGVGIIVILPLYLLTKGVYREKIKIKQHTVFFAFCFTFTPVVLFEIKITEWIDSLSIPLIQASNILGEFFIDPSFIIFYLFTIPIKIAFALIVFKLMIKWAKTMGESSFVKDEKQ